MRENTRVQSSSAGLILVGILTIGMTSCGVSQRTAQRAEADLRAAWPGEFAKANVPFQERALPILRVSYPSVAGGEYVNDDELCATCHQTYAETFQSNVHRGIHTEGHSCEACHGPASQHLRTKGKEPGTIISFKNLQPAEASEVCLKCHEQDACSPGAQWRTSTHAHACLSCSSCHTAHYNVPPGTPATSEPGANAMVAPSKSLQLVSFQESAGPASLRGTSNNLNAAAPDTCYRCHGDKADMQNIAGPHQILGDNCFNCTTCHDPHGQILEFSRKDLCLQCHNNSAPTMAYNSCTHSLMGVACTDCHNPHPNASVRQFVGISHYAVNRPSRLSMSVQEPEACYQCHQKIFAENALPSHHPIKEGKMICSDCHDPHGQRNGNLKADGVIAVNQLCYKCHADKQGPFAYPHPPVDENCAYCHAPHGTVANNLLKQPPNFLCLRCHVGHRQTLHGHASPQHAYNTSAAPNTEPGYTNNTLRNQAWANADVPSLRADIDRNPDLRTAFYTDCAQCHTQIHGSDVASGRNAGVLMR